MARAAGLLSEVMLVAIDGPAGAGKSTVARAVAAALGFTYLDTGAMYRAASLAADPTQARIDLDDGRVLLDGADVTGEIRTPEVSRRAREVASDPAVRQALVEQQRRLIDSGDWVAEGRDIGTVVAPGAVELDTTGLTLDEVVERVTGLVRNAQ